MIFYKKILFAILIALCVNVSHSFSQTIDSLKYKLRKAEGIQKLEILDQLAGNYWELDPGERIPYAEEMIELSENYKNTGYKVDAYNYLGIAYNQLDDPPKSIDFFFNALDLAEEIQDKERIAKSLQNLGQANFYLDNFDKSQKYFQQLLEIYKELADKKGISTALCHLGSVYAKTKRYHEALDYYFEALTMSRNIKDKLSISQIYNNIANVYFAMGETDKVLRYRLNSLEIIRELDNKWEIAVSTYNIAEYYLFNNEAEKAYPYLLESQKLAEILDNKGLIRDNIYFFSLYYELMGNYPKAIEYLKNYATIVKEHFSEKLSKTTAEMQTKYETEKKEKENEHYKLQLEKEKNTRIILYFGLLFIIILAVLLYYLYLHKLKTNKILDAALRKLELANKELEAFTYTVSHDLKAPLRAINSFSRFLYEDYKDIFDVEGRKNLDTILSNTAKMERLILDLLEFSHLSKKEINHSEPDMKQILKQVWNDTATDAEKKEFSITISDLPNVPCDPVLIGQVWQNLIGNALKYSAKSATKKIEVGYIIEKEMINYYVKDYGAGFDPEYTDKLFIVFQRLHSESEFQGTGIGLSIVKKIVNRHNGKVWAESRVEKGASFYFSIPKKR